MVTPTDVDKLTAAVVGLLEDDDKRRAFGVSGRERAVALFSEEKMCREMENLYERLISAAGS